MKVRIAAALAVASIIPALGAASAQAASSGMYSCPSFHAVHVSAGPYSAQFITHSPRTSRVLSPMRLAMALRGPMVRGVCCPRGCPRGAQCSSVGSGGRRSS